MSQVPTNLKYTKSHEWIKIEGNKATIGITDHAQQLLGDLVFIELPEVGTEIQTGNESGVVESVKAASDIYAPVAGVIVDVNENIMGEPETVNLDPYEKGWLYKIEMDNLSEVQNLLDSYEYERIIVSETH